MGALCLAPRIFRRCIVVLGIASSLITGPVSQGQGTQSPAKPSGIEERGIDVLTDTKGFDVEPYLKEIVGVVRARWFFVMPDTASHVEARARLR